MVFEKLSAACTSLALVTSIYMLSPIIRNRQEKERTNIKRRDASLVAFLVFECEGIPRVRRIKQASLILAQAHFPLGLRRT